MPDACYDLVYTIEYIKCSTESEMSIKEIYYINTYRNDSVYFNVLDTTDVPKAIEFNDEWMQYTGPLGVNFPHSINYIEGYTSEKEVKYNKDGTIARWRPNKEKGSESYVEGLTRNEVELVVEYMIDRINNAENNNQEQLCFRNLLMFVLGVNLPLKPADFLSLKYGDLFDENDCPKDYTWQLGRFHKDEKIQIPLRASVKRLLLAYTKKYGYSYKDNAEDSLFQSRKHQVVSLISWGRIVYSATEAVGIEKNIAAESIRKTYGLNVIEHSSDKLNAMLFLGEIWGQFRDVSIIKYLNLTTNDVDFEYYLGETFSIGNVDLSKIKCLPPNIPALCSNSNIIKKSNSKEIIIKQMSQEEKPKPEPKTKTKTNRLWPKEKKLEIVRKYLEQHIPQKELSMEYGVDPANISHWVKTYKQLGESEFEDKRFKNKV